MPSGEIDAAITSVDRLRRQVVNLAQDSGKPAKRPFLHDSESREVIQRVGAHRGPITFFVGAGASIEADLPSWVTLVRRLLEAIPPRRKVDRTEWEATLLESGPMAAAALLQTRSRGTFSTQVYRALYDDQPSARYRPGSVPAQIAYWRAVFGREVQIVTVNYDDLLEKALDQRGLKAIPVADEYTTPSGDEVPVYHLHGRLDDKVHNLDIVLSEADYARFPHGSEWQDNLMKRLLASTSTLCVFVGLSFTDPNLQRWLHRASANSAGNSVALFSRQSSPRLTERVRQELEDATKERWRAANVDVFFTDFFAEQAQILHEAALRRSGASLRHFERRAEDARSRAQRFFGLDSRNILPGQKAASDWLQSLLDEVRTLIRDQNVRIRGEQLGLGLWALDHAGGTIAMLGSSDRAHTDVRTMTPVPLELVSRWTSVETVTNGSARTHEPDVYASRWHYVRGIPLVLGKGQAGRVLVGAITLTSTKSRDGSAFSRLADSVLDEIDDLLANYGLLAFQP